MFSLSEPPLFTRLKPASSVLVARAGGGFDVYAQGKQVHLANLSFSDLGQLDLDDWIAPDVAAVGPDSAGGDEYLSCVFDHVTVRESA